MDAERIRRLEQIDRQPQVVVGAQAQHRPAVDPDLRRLRALDRAQKPAQVAGLELEELRAGEGEWVGRG